MTDYSDLVQRLRGPIKHPQQVINMRPEAADAIEAQAKRIEELEKEINCWHEAANWPEKSPLQLRSRIAELEQGLMQSVSIEVKKSTRIAELEHQLKFECDTYLWKRKLMSRRIAFLQGWMQKLFKYCSS